MIEVKTTDDAKRAASICIKNNVSAYSGLLKRLWRGDSDYGWSGATGISLIQAEINKIKGA